MRLGLPLTSAAMLVLAGCVVESDASDMPVPPTEETAEEESNTAGHGFSAEDEAACLAEGGTYARRGMLGQYGCTKPFPDAGKSCSKASDCEGECRVEDPQTGAGTCQKTDNPFGCRTFLDESGQMIGICVD